MSNEKQSMSCNALIKNTSTVDEVLWYVIKNMFQNRVGEKLAYIALSEFSNCFVGSK